MSSMNFFMHQRKLLHHRNGRTAKSLFGDRIMGGEGLLLEIFNKFVNELKEKKCKRQEDKGKQEIKKPKYVQISVESYSHLTGLEDQVKSLEEQVSGLEDEVKDLNEKLAAAQSEMTNKENLVKQYAEVAEEAVSGWEKAESEAAKLKKHLESVTLLKLTAEERASHLDGALKLHLDGALKEYVWQIRNLKEEHEQKLHDVIQNKTKQFDKMKHEFEAKLANLDQQLLRSAAENSALSRSLQERSSMEGVKKVEKLEAECRRLRLLVRKKLPGPTALAQMKLEVESLGRDYGDSRVKKSQGGRPSLPEFLKF